MKRAIMAAALALPAGVWAQAQIVVTTPKPHAGVPADGSSVNLPFSAKIVLPYPMFYCGGARYEWTRDETDPKTCTGHACKAYYPESAITRGPHTARVKVTYFWGYPNVTGCFIGYGETEQPYVVQYRPTVQITEAPSELNAGDAGFFSASGTLDPEYAEWDDLTYTWSFGDGGTATGPNVTHDYVNCGNYQVSVTVSDGALTATATTYLWVSSYYYYCDTLEN